MVKQKIVPAIVIALSILFLTACADLSSPSAVEQPNAVEQEVNVEDEATATPEPVAVEAVATEAAVSEEAILVPTVEPVVESVDWTQTASIDGDYYILGNPAAPIRLVDFSDFM
jgi:protein-disulfide isomerase